MREKAKLIVLLVIGLILAGMMTYFGLYWTRGQSVSLPKTRFFPRPSPTPGKVTTASLRLNPNKLSLYSGESLEIGIWAESEAKILGADLEIYFDPNLLEFEQIKPGKLLPSAQEIEKIISQEEGKIFYALGSFSSEEGKGTLVTLSFRAKSTLQPQETTISLSDLTNIAAQGSDAVKLNFPVSGKYTILN